MKQFIFCKRFLRETKDFSSSSLGFYVKSKQTKFKKKLHKCLWCLEKFPEKELFSYKNSGKYPAFFWTCKNCTNKIFPIEKLKKKSKTKTNICIHRSLEKEKKPDS